MTYLRKFSIAFLSVILVLSPGMYSNVFAQTAELTSGDYVYRVNEDNTATIERYSGTDFDIAIPESLDGHYVSEIGIGSFEGHTELISVTIPDSVKTISTKAFQFCPNIRSVSLSNSVVFIGKRAFARCYSLKYMIVPSSVSTIDTIALGYTDTYNINGATRIKGFTIIGDGMSAAQKYADNNEIRFLEKSVLDKVFGDADDSGKINIKDATLIQKAAASVESLVPRQTALSDVNSDADVNFTDATAVQKHVANLDT